MAFNILVGFQNLELKEEPKDPKNKVYVRRIFFYVFGNLYMTIIYLQ